jgi:hypothetical protein
MARPELSEGIDCLVISPEEMVELKTIELLLQLPNLLPICRHTRVTTIQLPHDLVDDEL